jgi:hypothetical protein
VGDEAFAAMASALAIEGGTACGIGRERQTVSEAFVSFRHFRL